MHVLIVGMTASGKTTLAKKILQTYKAKGIKTAVLDPLNDPTWDADFQTDDPEEFLDVVYRSQSCALFIDESGTAIGRYAGPMQVLATQSRHFGHRAYFITQRASQLDRTVRDQCETLFLFRVGKMDGDTMAEEFGYPELKQANILGKGECFRLGRFNRPEKISVFT